MSASFRSWVALVDEEFFVIEGSGVGRGAVRMRTVRLGGPLKRPVRRSAADARGGEDVHLYMDSSAAPLLDLRRRL